MRFDRMAFNMLRAFFTGTGPATVVPGEWARWLLEEAYRQTEAAGRPIPPDFARARSELGPVPAGYEVHPALAHWPQAERSEEHTV